MYDLWLLQITTLSKVDINLCPTEIMVNVRPTFFTSLKTDKFIGNIICVLNKIVLSISSMFNILLISQKYHMGFILFRNHL